jgi:hypothetical protein
MGCGMRLLVVQSEKKRQKKEAKKCSKKPKTKNNEQKIM